MAETLEQYIARIKAEHEQSTSSHKGTLDFFLSQIRELAAKAVPGKEATKDELKDSAAAAKKAEAAAKEISPGVARATVANTNILETNTTVTRQYYGRMLFFQYEAKLKMKLPYWDRFPLVFVISVKGDSFLAINLHYLPPVERAKLLFNLMTLANSEKLDHQTKLIMTYKLLSTSAKFRYFKPCIKRYLFGHLRSQVMLVDPKKWQEMIFMPLANFMKSSEYEVWEDSIKKIRNQTNVRREVP